jgi:UDP-N-acetylmuramate-alanine ligase
VTFFEKNKNAKRIQFTSWPIPDAILLNLKNNSTIPINILFDHLEIYDKEDLEKYNDTVKDFFDQFRPMEVTFPEEVDRINENLKVGTTIVPSNYNKLIKEFNIAKINKNSKKEIIFVKPKRGGFIWPGNKDLDSNIKEIVKKWFNFSLK